MVRIARASIYRSRIGNRELLTVSGARARAVALRGAERHEAVRWGRWSRPRCAIMEEKRMEGIVYLVGLVVIVMFVLSFLGLR